MEGETTLALAHYGFVKVNMRLKRSSLCQYDSLFIIDLRW